MMSSFSHTVALLLPFVTATCLVAQQPPADDLSTVYRIDHKLDAPELVPVDAEEIEVGLVYNYYHPELELRVWGFAMEGGDFRYAFGEGTIVPTDRFDLRITQELEALILEDRAPALQRILKSTGRVPALRLNESNEWTLLQTTSSARIFDTLTNRRWEWHGHRRVAVLHTLGYQWHVVDGNYEPLDAYLPVGATIVPHCY